MPRLPGRGRVLAVKLRELFWGQVEKRGEEEQALHRPGRGAFTADPLLPGFLSLLALSTGLWLLEDWSRVLQTELD